MPPVHGMLRRAALLAVPACLAVAAPALASSDRVSAPAAPALSTYIVQLKAPPLAAYAGGVSGLSATSPRVTGRKLDPSSPAAGRYEAYLERQQDRAFARLRGPAFPRIIYRYRNAMSGFAARLSPAQAQALATSPGVAKVVPDRLAHLDRGTAGAGDPVGDGGAVLAGDTTSFLGLPGGIWSALGGPTQAGAGVIVGVIDTGIYPEHPSFADQPVVNGVRNYIGPAYAPPKLWNGTCETGDMWSADLCNNKLIGARFFDQGFLSADTPAAGEFLSPRDGDGHGSHTAATAAGNYGVDPVIDGNDLGVDLISGVSPRSYVAAYKACWTGNTISGCFSSDTAAAIDAAVADGVDVINFSVGSDTSDVLGGPDGVGFLFAADAGVFVANSAGNAGPDPGTIGSPASVPWLTSVAATTYDHTFQAQAALQSGQGAGLTLTGESAGPALDPTPIVDGAAAALPGASADAAGLCLAGGLDPAKVAGKVVICAQGGVGRTDKSRIVQAAGGAGMLFYVADDNAGSSGAYPFFVPTVSLSLSEGRQARAFVAASADPTVSFTAGTLAPETPDQVAGFSSRGPQDAVPDIPKPDVAAPGSNVLAAAVPTSALNPPGLSFQVISGTSMASPHVAGAGALLTQAHPTWSPAEIKSALMTTATPNVLEQDGSTPADAFDVGSGRIDVTKAASPGLVLNAGLGDYLSYLEGVDPTLVSGAPAPIAASDLNLASISFSGFTGSATTTRTFTSVDPTRESWRVSAEGLGGITVTADPAAFQIGSGQTQAVDLTFSGTAPLDAYTFGAVVLTDTIDGRTVRIPVSIKPVKLAPPATLAIATDQAAGSQPLPLQAGFAGTLQGVGWGLAAPQANAGQSVSNDPDGTPSAQPGPGENVYDVTVPQGSQLLAAAISNVDGGNPGSTDLDLYTYYDANGDGQFTDDEQTNFSSATGAANEAVTISLPDAGRWRIVVVGFATKSPSTYDLTTWLADDPTPDDASDPPAIVVRGDPVTVAPGDAANLSVDWSGVTGDGTYLGLVTYHDGSPVTLPPADPNNLLGYSVVALTKTSTAPPLPPTSGFAAPAGVVPAASASRGPLPAGAPATAAAPMAAGLLAAADPGPAGAAASPVLAARGLSVRGRMISATVKAGGAASVSAEVLRNGRIVARTAAVRTGAAPQRLRLALDRRVAPGRYTLRITGLRDSGGVAGAERRLSVS